MLYQVLKFTEEGLRKSFVEISQRKFQVTVFELLWAEGRIEKFW